MIVNVPFFSHLSNLKSRTVTQIKGAIQKKMNVQVLISTKFMYIQIRL